MTCKSEIRLVPGADNAVLFIHGIAGTPNHFVTQPPLVDLVPEHWSVYNVLLHGHGGSVENFSKSSMKQWKAQVKDIFDSLCSSHKRVVLVGHSMGTLFAIQLAVERPEKVPFLFLLAVPMRPRVGLSAVNNSLRLVFGRIREDRPGEMAIRNACGVSPTRRIWKYLGWIPRFVELLAEIHPTQRQMEGLTVPCVVFQSEKDELVSGYSQKVLKKCGVAEVCNLRHSSHFYYDPADLQILQDAFTFQIQKKA